jgi:nucleotide-binding universal stress UspA family protein
VSTDFLVESVVGAIVDRHRVVVGFDGSAGSVAAVEWAAREAAVRHSSLRVVTCSAVPPQVDFYGVGARQAQCLADVVESTRHRHPGLVVESAATQIDPRDALLDEAANADLLVVGASEAGAARHLLFGSIARTAARRSPCPVVVVRGVTTRPVQRIVVAIDGSSASDAAVDWACAEATLHRAELRLVSVWDADGPRAEVRRAVDLAVAECGRWTTADVTGDVLDGSPAAAIVRASRDADLVVIGSRGRSGFKTALFGSVALSVAEDAQCPVAVTHPCLRRV